MDWSPLAIFFIVIFVLGSLPFLKRKFTSMGKTQGWCYTGDHIEANRVGVGQFDEDIRDSLDDIYFRNVTIRRGLDKERILHPIAFKIYDDDGVHYFSGVISKEWLDGDEVYAFAPLRFAEIDCGATSMKYYNKDTKQWVHL